MLERPRVLHAPAWPVHPRVRAGFTTRGACVRGDAYASFNLATHVGDDPRRVAQARAKLSSALGDVTIGWLEQVHGIGVATLERGANAPCTADAALTRSAGVACAILTADCLPVLVADRGGEWVGAAHCGWRGLADGVLSALLAALPTARRDVTAWIGPGIGAACYRVGGEVLERIESRWGADARRATVATASRASPSRREGATHADLEALARWQLRALGVRTIHGGGFCSARDPRFYSYRRDGATGRNVTLVWLDDG